MRYHKLEIRLKDRKIGKSDRKIGSENRIGKSNQIGFWEENIASFSKTLCFTGMGYQSQQSIYSNADRDIKIKN